MRKMIFSIINIFLTTCVIVLSNGCTSSMQLKYEKPPMKNMNKGEIYIIMDDQRPPDNGGDDPTRVGTIRNTFGMPFALRAKSDREPSKVIKELVSDCLKSAGYKTSEKPDGLPKMHVVLESFWSDGYQHSRMWTKIPIFLKTNQSSQPVWERTFEYNIGATWSVGYGPFNKAINKMLEELKNKMISEFNSPKFNQSVQSM